MKCVLTLVLALLCLRAAGQQLNQQGLREYYLLDKHDTVRFYLYNPSAERPRRLFLYLQGSGARPMISRTDSVECCFNNYPRQLMKELSKDYAVLYIQKVGVPYYANTDHYRPGATYAARNTVLDRAAVADKVLRYVLRRVYRHPEVVAVLGHSEGSDVAARLAVLNPRVTHLCFASGNGGPQIFNDLLFARRRLHQGQATSSATTEAVQRQLAGLDSVYRAPASVTKRFNGDTYRWHHAINQPPIDNLRRLRIPILLTIGSLDEKVPVEASDYIAAEFVRFRKANLTYNVYDGCDHSYVEHRPDGTTRDRWSELFQDFCRFINAHPQPH